jgi:Spy/CpxP family protein refolding chaperone
MKFSRKIAIGAAAALGLAAGVAIAHPGQMGGAMGKHGQMGGMQHGQMGGMQHGQMGGMGQGAMGAGPAAAQQLMTPEERAALREKMQNAKSAEERRTLAETNRAEMEKRAKEKGITLPEPHGPRAGFGPFSGPSTK